MMVHMVEFGTGNEEMGEKNYTMYLGLKGACAYCRVESSRSCIRLVGRSPTFRFSPRRLGSAQLVSDQSRVLAEKS